MSPDALEDIITTVELVTVKKRCVKAAVRTVVGNMAFCFGSCDVMPGAAAVIVSLKLLCHDKPGEE